MVGVKEQPDKLHRRRRVGVGGLVAVATLVGCGRAQLASRTGPPAMATTTVVMPSLGSRPLVSSPSPALPASTTSTAAPHTTPAALPAGDHPTPAVVQTYEAYLYDLSGIDDSLNQAWIPYIQKVTTPQLAQATVRAARTLLDAGEHGTGVLRDSDVQVRLATPALAVVSDCQDDKDFVIVSDNNGTPDPGIGRADYVGTATVVLQDGRWLVDEFRPSSATCAYTPGG